MMNVCWKLYEIVEKAFKDRTWANDEWIENLNSIGGYAEFVSGGVTPPGPDGHFDVMMEVISFISCGGATFGEEEIKNYTACPNPQISKDGMCSILWFPKEVAERVLILGFIPILEEELVK